MNEAVVADLVSQLALRVESEAARVPDLVTATREDIDAAVGAVRRMDVSLGDDRGESNFGQRIARHDAR